MPASVQLRHATHADWPEIAELIYLSTNHWYQSHGKPRIFSGPPSSALLFPQVYERLEPGCCVLAVTAETGKIAGSCFYHPRPTHVSLGIMNVHPNYFGRGVAARLLRHIIDLANAHAKPLRLVSSAMNLDSFSLYNRAGLVPYAVYQDMILKVPDGGIAVQAPPGRRLRDATPQDAAAMVELEMAVHGIRRDIDFNYFLANEERIWHVSVIEDEAGRLCGFLVSVGHPASRMLGPGVMQTDEDAITLIGHELNHHRGQTMVWLVPADRPRLVERMYRLGARNCELHFAQILGQVPQVQGIVMPTFMPESG